MKPVLPSAVGENQWGLFPEEKGVGCLEGSLGTELLITNKATVQHEI